VFRVADKGTPPVGLTVKVFEPAWAMAVMPLPMAPVIVEVELLLPTLVI